MKFFKVFPVLLLTVMAASGPADTAAQVVGSAACAPMGRSNLPGLTGRPTGPFQTLRCLQASGKLPGAGAPTTSGQFTTFDPPGSTFTVPTGITPDGAIVGYYDDASGVQHGFVRTPRGAFTTIDPPGATFTDPTSVTPAGQIAGAYCDSAACPRVHGFVRALDGTFTTFDAPGTTSGVEAGPWNLGGSPPSINPSGEVAGTSFDYDPGYTEHGFLRTKSGALTAIDVPGSTFTEVLAINPSGVTIGDSCDLTTCYTGFIRTPDGRYATINLPGGSCDGESVPIGGINAAGVVVGVIGDPSCSVGYVYVRAPDGGMTLFTIAGAINVEPMAINSADTIAGWFFTDTFHGFERKPDGAITAFDVPGSFGTAAFGIGPTGAIIGIYADANGDYHGFLRLS